MGKSKKGPNTKPTNKEIVTVVTQLINQTEFLKHQILSLTNVLDLLVEFDGKQEKFKEFAQAKMIERQSEKAEASKPKEEELLVELPTNGPTH